MTPSRSWAKARAVRNSGADPAPGVPDTGTVRRRRRAPCRDVRRGTGPPLTIASAPSRDGQHPCTHVKPVVDHGLLLFSELNHSETPGMSSVATAPGDRRFGLVRIRDAGIRRDHALMHPGRVPEPYGGLRNSPSWKWIGGG